MPTAASRLSNFFANRLRAALWIIAAGAGITLVVAVLIGLRSHPAAKTNPRRTVVAAYITRVGRIQIGMSAQVRAIDKQYKQFAHDPAGIGKRVATYRRAEKTLALLQRRLAAVKPPRETRRLQGLLLQLARQNVQVAHAVTSIAAYVPQLTTEQTALRTALLGLRGDVAKARTAKAQARAFAAYAVATNAIGERIARLRPPTFFVAAKAAELAQLRRISVVATGIGDALVHKRVASAQKLVGRLGQAEADRSVARAQRAGALAYNARLRLIRTLEKQIELERKRVEKRVPA